MSPARLACAGQWQQCLESIDDKGREGNVNDGNTDDSSGYTALHYAVGWGPREYVPLIISMGGDVNALTTAIEANNELQLASPLHLAAYHNKPDATEVLLEHGATVSAQTKLLEDYPAWLLGVNTFVRTTSPQPVC